MKNFFAAIAVTLLLTVAASSVNAADADEQRRQIDKLSVDTLERLYAKYPHAENVINNCYAWATLSNSGVKVLFIGSSHGRGLAYNNQTGEKVYLRMKELSAGIGLGAKELVTVDQNIDKSINNP